MNADSPFFSIAGISIKVTGMHECLLLDKMLGFDPFLSTENIDDDSFEVCFQGVLMQNPIFLQLSNSTILHQFSFDDESISCQFARQGESYLFSMSPADKSLPPLLFTYRKGTRVINATTAANTTLLRYALWMAFALFAAPSYAVPIHSSTIVYQNHAVLFLGESGTGKSTHTRLWLENIPSTRLLNDDGPILYCDGDIPMVSGSPWSGKTPCYHNSQFPLAAVVRLSQAPRNRIQQLSTMMAFSSLQPSCPPSLAYDEYYTDQVVELISKVISKVPVYHLECLPDAAAAQLCCKTIFYL